MALDGAAVRADDLAHELQAAAGSGKRPRLFALEPHQVAVDQSVAARINGVRLD